MGAIAASTAAVPPEAKVKEEEAQAPGIRSPTAMVQGFLVGRKTCTKGLRRMLGFASHCARDIPRPPGSQGVPPGDLLRETQRYPPGTPPVTGGDAVR